MLRYRIIVGFCVTLVLSSSGFSRTTADTESRQNTEVPWDVLDGGGGRSSSTNYILSGSLNQTAIGMSHNGHNTYAGYWYGVNFAPLPFSLISPTDNDTMNVPVVLEWEGNGDPDTGDTVRYCVYYSTDGDFSTADSSCCGSTEPACTVSGLLCDTTYYWKVKAYDQWWAHRWSDESWSFYTMSAEQFIRGDADGSGALTLGDGLWCFRCQFVPGWQDSCNCDDATDADDNGAISIGDCLRILRKQFVPGWQDSIPPPCCTAPGDCGVDPTEDGVSCEEHPCMGGMAAEAKRMRSVR